MTNLAIDALHPSKKVELVFTFDDTEQLVNRFLEGRLKDKNALHYREKITQPRK